MLERFLIAAGLTAHRGAMSSDFATRYAGVPAEELIRRAADEYRSGLVASSSFGIQSAVLLHLISQTAPEVPVIWIDTGYLPAETYRYAHRLSKQLNLDIRVYQSVVSPARMEALYGRLWESDDASDLDRYHGLRKVEPMRRALADLHAVAWMSGIRRDQTSHRRTMSRIMEQDGITRIHPIFHWDDRTIGEYFDNHNLPHHPLERQGYRTVGDVHLSAPEAAPALEADGRKISVPTYRGTRFKGKREECGLHLPKEGGWDALFT